MPLRPHLKLDTSKQKENPVPLKFNYGAPDEEEEQNESPNYRPTATALRAHLAKFESDRRRRVEERDVALQIPEHIEYINIRFHGQFSMQEGPNDFYQKYYTEFGLLGTCFSNFNHEVLFAIIDNKKFQKFLNNISAFIAKELDDNTNADYSGLVIYIKFFRLLTTAEIIQYRDHAELMNFRLIDFPLDPDRASMIYGSLRQYLDHLGLEYRLNEQSLNLEVFQISDTLTKEIVRNFDIVLNVTSGLSTIIRPNEFNLPERGYGFEIDTPTDSLPVIGIIDTGISALTPLAPLLIQDEAFNLTDTSVFEDNAFDGIGHGTAVAALAALGTRPYTSGYKGSFKADARLLSIKILDGSSGYLAQSDVLLLLKNAKAKYPEMKIFVLTTCYTANKRTNEDFSSYAFELDRFAYENDCLVFIATANNNDCSLHNSAYDLNYFVGETTNLCVPADSMNNVVVGAAADGLSEEAFSGISSSKEFPAIYTRKCFLDLSVLFSKVKQNKHYFRPDIIASGGDYEQCGRYIDKGVNATLNVLSANPAHGFYKDIGTSFSTPLAANIAATLLRQYPKLRAQTVKALIINGATCEKIRFPKEVNHLLNKTCGYGLVDPGKSSFSNDNAITFVIEDEIGLDEMTIVPIYFPKYLIERDLGKKRSLLRITATLCFSFEPVLNNQLSYCPLHIGFSIFRNHDSADILKPEDTIKSKIKQGLSWSQNARYVTKPIPYINRQKIEFTVSYKDLVDESSTFKLAVGCRLTKQLLSGTRDIYKKAHQFSIALTIQENLTVEKQTGRLYSEMKAINEIINIVSADAQLKAEADLDNEV